MERVERDHSSSTRQEQQQQRAHVSQRRDHVGLGVQCQQRGAPDVATCTAADLSEIRPDILRLVPAKLAAVREFVTLPEAQALAAANKRIVNILKKAEGEIGDADVALLVEPAEKALFHAVVDLAPSVHSLVGNGDYTAALKALAALRGAVDTFFDEVMVNAEEPLVRANRLALLRQLAGLTLEVADLSRLSV